MDKTPQELFDEMKALKSRRKQVNEQIKQHYESDPTYQELSEKRKDITAKLKPVKAKLNEGIEKLLTEKDDLNIDIKATQDLLNDIALSKVVKGETFEVKDESNQLYLPLFNVKLEKQ